MWAGPAQVNGPNPALTKLGPISAQELLQSRPGPAQTCKAGPALGWPSSPRPSEGELFFSPPSPACKTILHAGGNKFTAKGNAGGRACTWRGGGGRWWRCGGVARGRRLRAVLWRFERRRERLIFSGFLPRLFFVFGFGFFVFGLFLLSPLFRALFLFSLSPRVSLSPSVSLHL